MLLNYQIISKLKEIKNGGMIVKLKIFMPVASEFHIADIKVHFAAMV